MTEIAQPHDGFFTKVFSSMGTAEDILFSNIPLIASYMTPGSFESCGEKFVNTELKRYYSDLLLKARLKNGSYAYVYLLLEHKSYPEPEVAFDLMQYRMRFWEKVRVKGKALPFVLQIVIYHGHQKWKAPTNLADLVETPEGLEAYTPRCDYYLYDLSQFTDEEIKGAILSRVILLLFKHIYDEDFGERFIGICRLLGELGDEKSALEFLRSVLEFIGSATDKITTEQVRKGVEKALPQTGGEQMPTLFEQFKEEGREEGRGEGVIIGLHKGIRLALELKYGKEGLDFHQQIQDTNSLDDLNKLEDLLRRDIPLNEIKSHFH